MSRTLLLAVFVLLFIASTSVYAQVDSGLCGDVDGDGYVCLSDVASFGLYFNSGLHRPPFYEQADCDGKVGITFADLNRLIDHVFVDYTPLNCSASGLYSNTLSITDTVYMPLATCIPPESTEVVLTCRVRIRDESHSSIQLPINPLAEGSNNVFAFNGINEAPAEIRPDGMIVITSNMHHHDSMDFRLSYHRVAEGYGEIHTELRDIDTRLRYVVVSDITTDAIDLHRPVVVYEWQSDYPPGDLNCDCRQSLADLMLMISGLFISLDWPPPCRCGD